MSELQWNLLNTKAPAEVAASFNPMGSYIQGTKAAQDIRQNELGMRKIENDIQYNPYKIMSKVNQQNASAALANTKNILTKEQLGKMVADETLALPDEMLKDGAIAGIRKVTKATGRSLEENTKLEATVEQIHANSGPAGLRKFLEATALELDKSKKIEQEDTRLAQGQQGLGIKQQIADNGTFNAQTFRNVGMGNLAVNQQKAQEGSKAVNQYTTFYKGFRADHPEMSEGELNSAANQAWQEQQTELAKATSTARGEGYGANRVTQVLDTKNGNIPVPMSNVDVIKGNKAEPGRYITGTQGSKALNQTVLVKDIRGTINNVRGSLEAMEEFSAKDRAQIALVLKSRDPHSAASAFLQGSWGDTLSDAQKMYVIDLAQLHENAMAMRSVLGAGQGSDELRAAITKTIPGPGTPNKEFAAKQLDRFEETLNRLSRGIPKVPLRNAQEVQQTADDVDLPTPLPGTFTPPQGQGPISINSEAERQALPPGTEYIAPDGSIRRKK